MIEEIYEKKIQDLFAGAGVEMTAVTIKQISNQIAKVNIGENVEADYKELRRLQKQFASALVARSSTKGVSISPGTLRQLRNRDFPSGVIIRVRKYRIICDGLGTRAYHIKKFRDLRSREMPLYLKEFIGV